MVMTMTKQNNMKISKHVLVHAKDAGNGYHGNCLHCGLPLVTDLGYDSWSGTKCIEREIEWYLDIPKEIRDYAQFRGMHWDNKAKIFKKPYSEEEFTIDQLNEKLLALKVSA